MKIICNQGNSLNEKIDRFWDLDTIGIKQNETSVLLVTDLLVI